MTQKQYECWLNQRLSKINELNKIIELNLGEWLGGDYSGGKSLITIKCFCNNIWTTKASNILTGRWCPKCAKLKASKAKKKYAHIRKITRQVEYITSGQRFRDQFNLLIKSRQSCVRKYEAKIRAYNKSQLPETKKMNSEKYKEKYNNDISFCLNERLKGQLRKCLVKDRIMGKYYNLLGYTTEELKDHLESLFIDGMSWNNMSQWHIDHVRPKSWFNLLHADGSVNEEEVRKCWALSNLQPLWAKDNISKRNYYEG